MFTSLSYLLTVKKLLLNMETEKKDIRKVVIRAPESLQDQIASFGAIRFLKSKYPEAFIEVICRAGHKNVYDYLSDISKIHQIEEEKDSVLGVFPWIHNNSNLFGVDTFIDFHGGASAATMGIGLKAKRRVAYSTTMTKPMLTQSLKAEEQSDFKDTAFLTLVGIAIEEEIPQKTSALIEKPSDKESAQLQMLGNYLFVGIRASEWERHQQIWANWFDELVETNFVVVIDQDIENDDVIKNLRSRKSSRFFLIEKSFPRTDLLFMNASRGVLTDSALYGNLASFHQHDCLILAFDLNDYPSFETYLPRPEIIIERKEQVSVHIDEHGEKNDVDASTALDIIVNVFKL